MQVYISQNSIKSYQAGSCGLPVGGIFSGYEGV